MIETAKCRHCRKTLVGKSYHLGGSAYDSETGERARVNYFGGYVCSRQCDEAECLRMLSSMPGAGPATRLDSLTRESVDGNWQESP